MWGRDGASSSSSSPWDCGVATKTVKRSILLLRCVDVGLRPVEHSSCEQYLGLSALLQLSFLLLFLPPPPPPPPLSFPKGWREEVEPKCAMSATCFCPSRSSSSSSSPSFFSFDSSPTLLRRVHRSALLPFEGMQYCRPSA